MKTYEVTITSKNQITIPAEVVRKLNLSKRRILTLSLQGENISLTPGQEIFDIFRKYSSTHCAKKALTDVELNSAMRDIAHKIKV